jgi:hypothetical protein
MWMRNIHCSLMFYILKAGFSPLIIEMGLYPLMLIKDTCAERFGICHLDISLLVQRLFDPSLHDGQQFMTDRFEVYKLVLDDESGRVVERVKVKNID